MTRSRDVADSQDNLGGAVAPFVAGKNAIINGGMDIWQRGTSFAVAAAGITFTADRWFCITGTGTATYSQETSIVPTNSRYAMKMLATATTQPIAGTVMETQNSLSFAGKTVVVSAQVAASTSTPMSLGVQYSTTVDETPTGATWVTVTASSGGTATPTSTTYVPITGTYAIPSTAKTIKVFFLSTSNIANTVALYASGVQLELGAVATPFARAGGSIGGELALCQRYFQRYGAAGLSGQTYSSIGSGYVANAAGTQLIVDFPMITPMRIAPSSVSFNSLLGNNTINNYAVSAVTLRSLQSSATRVELDVTIASATQHRPLSLISDGSSSYLDLNGEL